MNQNTPQAKSPETIAAELAAAQAAQAAAQAAAKQAAQAAKQAAAQAAAQAREAAKQPVQNGKRRPGPNGKCGRAWGLMDAMSAEIGGPVAIGDLLERSRKPTQQDPYGMNDNMVRANYASWKIFYGLTGRIPRVVKPTAPADTAPAEA